jgi:hypothetical protein
MYASTIPRRSLTLANREILEMRVYEISVEAVEQAARVHGGSF